MEASEILGGRKGLPKGVTYKGNKKA